MWAQEMKEKQVYKELEQNIMQEHWWRSMYMHHKHSCLPTEQIIYKKKWISCIIKKHQYHAWHIFLWQIKNQNENDTIISSVVNIDQEAVATANISSQATDSSV